MAYIYLHPGNMQNYVDVLKRWANSNFTERQDTSMKNSQNSDPAEIASKLSEAPQATIEAARHELWDKMTDLQTRLNEAKRMNESGLSPTDGEMISYYLPSDDASMDTTDNVKAYNSKSESNGYRDATALQQARKNGKSDDGRTADEIMAEIAKHQDIPTYGASFVKTTGAAKMLDMPLRMNFTI